eukprot:COSAG02_NODE_8689_length_2478_cov_13.980210_2_plen_75_part_00
MSETRTEAECEILLPVSWLHLSGLRKSVLYSSRAISRCQLMTGVKTTSTKPARPLPKSHKKTVPCSTVRISPHS